jgi:hypothetical protein
MEIELNSWEYCPSSAKTGQQLDHAQAMLAVRNMCTCLDLLIEASLKRTSAVGGNRPLDATSVAVSVSLGYGTSTFNDYFDKLTG